MVLLTPRGHDLSLLLEMQELTPAQRIARNCEMAAWIEKLQAATRELCNQIAQNSFNPVQGNSPIQLIASYKLNDFC